VTPDSGWWDQDAAAARNDTDSAADRLCMLRKGEHQITLEKRIVAGYGDELIRSVNAEWRRMRTFRVLSELGTALEETIVTLQRRGWQT
jgi:hypothetical protein